MIILNCGDLFNALVQRPDARQSVNQTICLDGLAIPGRNSLRNRNDRKEIFG